MSSNDFARAWFSTKTRSRSDDPVKSSAAGAVKYASQFQPALSRLGQSVKTSTAFCRSVSYAAAKILTRSPSDERNAADLADESL